ncbi:MAG: hypothetical protein HQM04_10775 [Magnetococcales bacterium]|nr:hypothetical protein [Magnetococcales bacterium]MBF0115507.1 hypothetical protein [Magnetococcales bacterium]
MANSNRERLNNQESNNDSVHHSQPVVFDKLIQDLEKGEINRQKGLEMGLRMVLAAFHQKKRGKKKRHS